ncbi:velvet factor, partial [Protomyces lactucae-debilis]
MSVANYNFVAAADMRPACDNSSSYRLVMRQQPRQARACSNKERERKPIDPPPVVQVLYGQADKTRNYMQSPYMFVVADLVRLRQEGSLPADIASGADLLGTVVGSLNKLRDPDAEDGGFFIFSDIYVKHEGLYRLRFTLFEINPRSSLKSGAAEVAYITNVWSEDFRVYGIKDFPGPLPSTKLSRIFCEQGVRLKLRKEAR